MIIYLNKLLFFQLLHYITKNHATFTIFLIFAYNQTFVTYLLTWAARRALPPRIFHSRDSSPTTSLDGLQFIDWCDGLGGLCLQIYVWLTLTWRGFGYRLRGRCRGLEWLLGVLVGRASWAERDRAHRSIRQDTSVSWNSRNKRTLYTVCIGRTWVLIAQIFQTVRNSPYFCQSVITLAKIMYCKKTHPYTITFYR